jgi:hypothetical protein
VSVLVLPFLSVLVLPFLSVLGLTFVSVLGLTFVSRSEVQPMKLERRRTWSEAV